MEIDSEFSCVEMKRKIQEQIYEETKDLTREEYRAYLHEKIKNSRFSSWLDRPAVNYPTDAH